MSIRSKSALFFVLCSVVPIFAMATMAFQASRDTMRARIDAELVATAQQELDRIEAFFADARTDLKTWSNLRSLRGTLAEDQSGNTASELRTIGERYPHFTELLLMNNRGMVVDAIQANRIRTDMSSNPAFKFASQD